MYGQAGRAHLRAIVMALVVQCFVLGFFGWRVDNAIVTRLGIAAVQQNSRVSNTKAITCTRLIGNEALEFDVNPSTAFEVLCVRFRLMEELPQGTPKEELVVSCSSDIGPEYTATLTDEKIHKKLSWCWQPTRPVILCQKSGLHIEWPNSGEVQYGIEVYWRSV